MSAPLDPVRFCPSPFKNRFSHSYPVAMDHKAETIHGAACHFSGSPVYGLKAENLPILFYLEAEFFPKIAEYLPDHLVEFFLVLAE